MLGLDRTSVRYQATMASDTELRDQVRALAQKRRRFGYRRLHVLLRREDHANEPQAGSAALLRGGAGVRRADTSISGLRVICEFGQQMQDCGCPQTRRSGSRSIRGLLGRIRNALCHD